MLRALCWFFIFFFFKQKTAYEIKECDWSSDVCSSDLPPGGAGAAANRGDGGAPGRIPRRAVRRCVGVSDLHDLGAGAARGDRGALGGRGRRAVRRLRRAREPPLGRPHPVALGLGAVAAGGPPAGRSSARSAEERAGQQGQAIRGRTAAAGGSRARALVGVLGSHREASALRRGYGGAVEGPRLLRLLPRAPGGGPRRRLRGAAGAALRRRDGLSGGRHPGQARPHVDGGLPRGPGPVPRPRGRRVCDGYPGRMEAPGRGHQVDSEAGIPRPAPAGDPAPRQGGIQHADEELAAGSLAAAAARAARHRAGARPGLVPAPGGRPIGGRAPARSRKPRASPLVPDGAGAVARRPRAPRGRADRRDLGSGLVSAAAPLDERVRSYWNERIHDLEMTTAPAGSAEFFRQLDAYRFEKLDYLPRLVDFGGYAGRRVLEIGCGVGTDLARFARGGARVSGVDLSETAVDLARRNLAHLGLAGDLRVADGTKLPWPDGSFDLVYCHGVLQYAADPRGIVREAHRVLAPEGEAIFMVYNRRSWLAGI